MDRGICGVRRLGPQGHAELPFYGRISALSLDPIEKKPLKHFHGGNYILSVGFLGCNAHCSFCQNWHISQDLSAPSDYLSPEELASLAKEKSFGLAYTYSEPLIHYEYLLDTMIACHEKGVSNVLVSNANILPDPAKTLFSYLDAANFDVKTYSPQRCLHDLGIDLEAVKATIRIALEMNVHVEISTLVVPGFNDDSNGLMEIAEWIASQDKNIPWHLAACHPAWKYRGPSCSKSFIQETVKRAQGLLHHVYPGNI